MALYAWTLRLSASFYPLLAGIEVSLRNKITARLEGEFGTDWWQNEEFSQLLGKKGQTIVRKSVRALSERNLPLSSGRITDELSFGFWRNMLLAKYETRLWTPLSASFDAMPREKTRSMLEHRCEEVLFLRNRISHHEPLLKRDITKEYSQALELLHWLSPEKAAWLKPELETMRILRQRP